MGQGGWCAHSNPSHYDSMEERPLNGFSAYSGSTNGNAHGTILPYIMHLYDCSGQSPGQPTVFHPSNDVECFVHDDYEQGSSLDWLALLGHPLAQHGTSTMDSRTADPQVFGIPAGFPNERIIAPVCFLRTLPFFFLYSNVHRFPIHLRTIPTG